MSVVGVIVVAVSGRGVRRDGKGRRPGDASTVVVIAVAVVVIEVVGVVTADVRALVVGPLAAVIVVTVALVGV